MTRSRRTQNRGSTSRSPDLVAPGRSIVSLRAPNSYIDQKNPVARVTGDQDDAYAVRYFRGSGTSQSAAVVSGVAALLLQHRPNMTPDQVKCLLTSTAYRIPNVSTRLQGAGLLDVKRAIESPTPACVQRHTRSSGTGTLEGARGGSHVADIDTGVELIGSGTSSEHRGTVARGRQPQHSAAHGQVAPGTVVPGRALVGQAPAGLGGLGRGRYGRASTGQAARGRVAPGVTQPGTVAPGQVIPGRAAHGPGRTWSVEPGLEHDGARIFTIEAREMVAHADASTVDADYRHPFRVAVVGRVTGSSGVLVLAICLAMAGSALALGPVRQLGNGRGSLGLALVMGLMFAAR